MQVDGVDGSGVGAFTETLEPARWWHLEGRRERVGPLDLDAMRWRVIDGTVLPDTLVWADGMSDWMAARDVPALVPPASTAWTLPAWRS